MIRSKQCNLLRENEKKNVIRRVRSNALHIKEIDAVNIFDRAVNYVTPFFGIIFIYAVITFNY